jgi:uncharacterized membrane protein
MNRSPITITAAVGSGIVGGVLFAFSTFVMAALDELPPNQAIDAMQAINRRAPNPLFMAALFGTAIATVVIEVDAVQHLSKPGSRLRMTAGALYLLGVATTAGYHVPKNNGLAKVNSTIANAGNIWKNYSSSWTALNHVRTGTSLAASLLFIVALRASAGKA